MNGAPEDKVSAADRLSAGSTQGPNTSGEVNRLNSGPGGPLPKRHLLTGGYMIIELPGRLELRAPAPDQSVPGTGRMLGLAVAHAAGWTVSVRHPARFKVESVHEAGNRNSALNALRDHAERLADE
jgi:hypothetical protein